MLCAAAGSLAQTDTSERAAAGASIFVDPEQRAGDPPVEDVVIDINASSHQPEVGTLQPVSALLRKPLLGMDGNEIGSIRDIVIDGHSGQLRCVVLAVERFLVDRLVAARPDARLPQPASDAGLLASTREQAERAPRFEEARWPVLDRS